MPNKNYNKRDNTLILLTVLDAKIIYVKNMTINLDMGRKGNMRLQRYYSKKYIFHMLDKICLKEPKYYISHDHFDILYE
jgi:hypothetical protein